MRKVPILRIARSNVHKARSSASAAFPHKAKASLTNCSRYSATRRAAPRSRSLCMSSNTLIVPNSSLRAEFSLLNRRNSADKGWVHFLRGNDSTTNGRPCAVDEEPRGVRPISQAKCCTPHYRHESPSAIAFLAIGGFKVDHRRYRSLTGTRRDLGTFRKGFTPLTERCGPIPHVLFCAVTSRRVMQRVT